ncbi:MAG: hypothetical protein IPJ73_02200 [Zoogloea sp.]|nr:hypothetical protein [Zoogloea sp.]
MKRSKQADFAKLSTAAKASYQALEPSDLLNKHAWLFRENWVEESADELHDDDMDYTKREERIAKLRTEAMREIFEARGLPGIFELAEKGNAASQIGWLTVKGLIREDDVPGLLVAALPPPSNSQSWAKKNLIAGTLRLDDEKKRVSLLKKAKNVIGHRLCPAAAARAVPTQRRRIVDKLDEQSRQMY